MATSATEQNKSDDERIQHAVVEFLRYHGMKNTIECFEVEAQQKLKVQTQLLSPRSGGKGPEGMRFRVKREMLACFEDGLSARFFAAWDKHVPMDLRDNDKTARKLGQAAKSLAYKNRFHDKYVSEGRGMLTQD